MILIFLFTSVVCLLQPSLTEAGPSKVGRYRRVVNGEDASPHAWPWMVYIRKNGQYGCGGALIDPNWVVTSSSGCFYEDLDPSSYEVVVGAHKLSETTAVKETLPVRQVFKHKGFSFEHAKNDIALIELGRPAKLGPQVNTVDLPKAGSKAAVGEKCYMTGWGRTAIDSSNSDVLQQAMVPVASDSDCANKNADLVVPVDKETMICAGGNGKGGCRKDGGAPLVCEENGQQVLRGVGSLGHPQCDPNFYGVFARVSTFVDWIDKKVKAGS